MFGKIVIGGCALVYFLLGAWIYVNGWEVFFWHGISPPVAGALVMAFLLILSSIGLRLEKRWAPALALLAWMLPPLLFWLITWERSPVWNILLWTSIPRYIPGLQLILSPVVLPILWYARRRFRAVEKAAEAPVLPPPVWRRLVVGAALFGMLLLPGWILRPSRAQPIIRESSVTGVRPVRILFIGNSLTYSNDMPAMLMALGAADQRPISTGMIVGGGFTLHLHVVQDVAPEVLAQQGPWDFVVLQEQSWTPQAYPGETYRSLQALEPAILRAGAKPVLLDIGPMNDWGQLARVKTFAAAERELAMAVVPVSEAWDRFGHVSDLDLLDGTAHPSPAGAYLIACTLYAALLNRNPEGVPAALRAPTGELLVELPSEQARLLQSLAWEVVQGRQHSEVPSLQGEATSLLFFEGDGDDTPMEKHQYRHRFKQSETRGVYWELHLHFSPLAAGLDFPIEVVYSRADGTILGKYSATKHRDADWLGRYYWGAWGQTKPGSWEIGSYRVDLLIEGKKVASKSFEIYQD